MVVYYHTHDTCSFTLHLKFHDSLHFNPPYDFEYQSFNEDKDLIITFGTRTIENTENH